MNLFTISWARSVCGPGLATHSCSHPSNTCSSQSPPAARYDAANFSCTAGSTLPPLLIMQGALDDNVLPAVQEKFAASYRAAGGECELHVFEGCEHEWVAKPGPQTDRAHDMVKTFIARHLAMRGQAAAK